MKLRIFTLAVIAATSISAQAGLTTYKPWDTSPPAGSSGLPGVLFNVQTANGVTVALGAHAYKNGVNLANNGVDTFYAQSGLYAETPVKNYANWSFDFAWDLGNCTDCKVFMGIDNDPTAGVSYQVFDVTTSEHPNSLNMRMNILSTLGFNAFASSSTGFELYAVSADGVTLAKSEITVNVPEPGSLALLGLGLVGLAAARRRKLV